MKRSHLLMNSICPIAAKLNDADHVDAVVFNSNRSMESYIERMLGFQPVWLKCLYRVRCVLARFLGLKHEELLNTGVGDRPDFYPGGQAKFFQSVAYEQGSYWLGEACDKHLCGYMGVIRDIRKDGSTDYHTFTIVKYIHWTGPLYFNLIRPFHHLVVKYMGRYAAR